MGDNSQGLGQIIQGVGYVYLALDVVATLILIDSFGGFALVIGLAGAAFGLMILGFGAIILELCKLNEETRKLTGELSLIHSELKNGKHSEVVESPKKAEKTSVSDDNESASSTKEQPVVTVGANNKLICPSCG